MVSRASPARVAAFQVLRDVEKRRGEPVALLNEPRYQKLSEADRDLTTEISYGVLRWRNVLDFVLAHHSKRPLHKIDAVVITALRIGLYQIRFLDRVPDRAAVDESVRLAHSFGASWSASFVNGVLRNVLRHPGEPALPPRTTDPITYLTTAHSHPEWLVRRYLDRLGLEGAEARCQRQNSPPPVHLRVRKGVSVDEVRRRLGGENVATETLSIASRCLRVVSGRVQESVPFEKGLVLLQDAGAQLISSLLEVSKGDVVLDMCAAPGGKATALGEDAGEGFVVALDRRHRRARLVRELSSRLDVTRVFVTTADARRPPVRRRFHRILLDAPCSSLGTLRRNPDIKWRASERDLARHAALQRELLHSSATMLEPGGRLVYATCSSEPEENEHVVSAFLEEVPKFRLLPVTTAPHLVTSEGFFQTRPERDDTDGYFAAILTRD